MRLSRNSSSDSNRSSRRSSSSRSNTSSSSPASSPSRSRSRSASSVSGKSSSVGSVNSKSSDSRREKKKLKASERKASSQLEATSKLNEESDSEDEEKKESNTDRNKTEVSSPVAGSISNKDEDKDTSIEAAKSCQLLDEFDDGLDEDLMGDDDDRRMLGNMTEREREEELFKRAERREELRKRREIAQKLQQKQGQSVQKTSPNVSEEGEIISSPESKNRNKGYEVKHAKKFSALSALKAKREEKEKKDIQRKEKEKNDSKKRKKTNENDSSSSSDMEKLARRDGKKKKKMKASEIYSSSSDSGAGKRRSSSSSSSSSKSSSSGESDTERLNTKKVVKKAQLIETSGDLERIRLSRHKLDKFVHLPIFKTTVVGCFVRISIGQNVGRGVPVYRVAEVVDVCETAKVYNVGSSRTNVGLRLKHGKDSKVFRAEFVSNKPFTEGEFGKWKSACETDNVELPSMRQIEEKTKAIQKALTYRFSNADVEKIIAAKQKFRQNPKNYAVYKAKLMKDKVQAVVDGNTEEVERLDIQLAELEERAEELDKKRTGTLANISFINDRNRKQNVMRAEKGITEDIQRQKQEGKIDDPFTRRKTRPILSMPKSNSTLNEKESRPEMDLKKTGLQGNSVSVDKEEKENKAQNFKSMERSYSSVHGDMYNVHDFDIDINIGNEGPTVTGIAVNPVGETMGGVTKKNSIKIDEWKRKRGIL